MIPYKIYLVPPLKFFQVSFYPVFTESHHLESPLEVFQDFFVLVSPQVLTSLGATLGSLPGFCFCVCALVVGAWCCCCLAGYRCNICVRHWSGSIPTSCRRPLCLLVYCCSVTLRIILNNEAIFLNAVWCLSLIVAKIAFGVELCNASTKSCAARIDTTAEETLGIIIFWVETPTMTEIISANDVPI